MLNFFHEDSHLGNFVTTVADVLVLNLLWIAGCLPLITIGTSTTALYQCLMERHREKTVNVFQAFSAAYKSNFKRTTPLFLLTVLLGCLLAFDVYLILYTQVGENVFVLLILLCVLFQVLPASGYVFPLQAYFECGIGQTLKNAWKMSFVHFPTSICVLALNLAPIALLVFAPAIFIKTIMVWILGGFAAIAYLNTILLTRIFIRYTPNN
jgi:uncharacterized membrane protein YesL